MLLVKISSNDDERYFANVEKFLKLKNEYVVCMGIKPYLNGFLN